jgi:predicted DCC family thiol-disulfide oxidoreductase YuxK
MKIDLTRKFEVYFDGACHLCSKEINMLRFLDRRDRIIFTDIAAADFDAVGHTGITYDALMGAIHGRVEGAPLVEGVEVFRQLYGRVGLKSIIWLSRVPGVSHLLDFGYVLFAENRLKWTGRCDDGLCEVPENHRAGS